MQNKDNILAEKDNLEILFSVIAKDYKKMQVRLSF